MDIYRHDNLRALTHQIYLSSSLFIITMLSLFGGLHGVILTHLLQSGNSMKVFHLDTLSPWVLFGEHALTDGISDGEIHPLGVSKKS